MVELKWTSYSEFNPEGEYFAVIAVDKRKSVWSFFHIVMRGRAVQRQAKTAKGLIGNMGRVEFLGKTVLNFAVFENEKAEAEFVHTEHTPNAWKQLNPS
jgi:hypothetical protein